MFGKILVLVLAASLVAAENTPIPQLFCVSTIPYICNLQNEYLLRDQPHYKIISVAPSTEVITVTVTDSKLAVLGNDVCQTFPKLMELRAIRQGIEVVTEEAFASCFKLKTLDLSFNQINIIPEATFRNNYLLETLSLSRNRIDKIFLSQFVNNVNLVRVNLEENYISTLPLAIFMNSPNIEVLSVHTNELIEFQDNFVGVYLAKLKTLEINGNTLLCSKVRVMVQNLRNRGITVPTTSETRQRVLRLTNVENFSCIDGQ